jgi:sugar lactone lactonase YvrE
MLLCARPLARAQDVAANEGGDLSFGGPGAEPGKFLELRDITFDAQGNLYTLDGVRRDLKKGTQTGNLRVQKFSNAGELLSAFSLAEEATGEKLGDANDPQRIAVDARGQIFVTQPVAGRVQQFAPDGKLVRSIELPGAMAITTVGAGAAQRIAVVPGWKALLKGKSAWLGGDRIEILAADGTIERTIPLAVEKPLEHVLDAAADGAGNFYVQAEPNAIHQFSPEGQLVRIFGGNPTSRSEDGSEVLHTVAVDPAGNVFTFTPGNPGQVTRFDADGRTVTQRGGQFKWADPWSVHSSYAILAIDPAGRLWAASTHLQKPEGVHFAKYHATPAIIRTKADFFENPPGSVRRAPVYVLGYKADLKTALPSNVAYEPGQPVTIGYVVAPAHRHVEAAAVEWEVVDALKTGIAKGRFDLPLRQGEEARGEFTFVPPRCGAYFVLARASAKESPLGSVGEHLGVTPRWPGMQALEEGESKGGWEDPARQLWTGLPLIRLHPAKKWDKLEADLALAERHGATVLVQLVDQQKNFDAAETRALMERFKGRIHFVEVCNEPNFSGSPEDYFKIHQAAFDAVKAVDPTVQVMGPATVNMNLEWLRRLYALGFKKVTDVISVHDYEGHESISPEHWRWKLAEVRKIMADNGDSRKAIWQTERAISAVRGRQFQGLVQAIRVLLHRDLLETLGIPSEHNSHYYLNQGGYSSVPSYLWSSNGPHPGAFALRTRHALTTALGRRFAGQLDFGRHGNEWFLGVRYAGEDGETVTLRNLGTRDTPLDFTVRGTTALDVVDAWGNARTVAVRDGQARLELAQLPTYVRLPRGAQLIAPALDFGENVAAKATFAFSATTAKGALELLNNGILETYHGGNPNGDTNGAQIWTGDLPDDLRTNPQSLEITFPQPQTISRAVFRGVRADNAFCALLAYDLQYHDGTNWKTIETIDRPMPPWEEASTADATGVIWMDDTNFFVHEFAPVTATRLRVQVRDTTRGFIPDDAALANGKQIPRKLMLREVELYAP